MPTELGSGRSYCDHLDKGPCSTSTRSPYSSTHQKEGYAKNFHFLSAGMLAARTSHHFLLHVLSREEDGCGDGTCWAGGTAMRGPQWHRTRRSDPTLVTDF